MASENHNTAKIAILYFARSPGSEAKEKRILNSSQRNKSLFAILDSTIQKQLKSVGFDVFFWNERHQRGNNFAKRFTHAFECIYTLGYNSIISVGNDTPNLRISDILAAAEELESGNKLVLGPSNDGGAYLIGLDQHLFHASIFQAISWQTKDVFEQLRSLSTEALILDTKIDLDDLKGFFAFLRSEVNMSPLVRRIRDLFISLSYPEDQIHFSYSYLTPIRLHSRPPPLKYYK